MQMRQLRQRRRLATVFILSVLMVAGPAPKISGATQNVVVSPHPIETSPQVLDGRIYAITQLGDRIVVGGTFSSVRDWNSDVILPRNRIFAFGCQQRLNGVQQRRVCAQLPA